MTDPARAPSRCLAVAVAVTALLLLTAPAALAHGDEHEPLPVEEAPEPAPTMPMPGPRQQRLTPTLELRAPAEAALGEVLRLEAVLLDPEGMPIAGAPVTFVADAGWGEVTGEMVLGTVLTDDRGVAVLRTDLRRAGEVTLGARFPGDERFEPAETPATVTVEGDRQLYTPQVGIALPGLGAWWLLVLVGSVWGVYLLVARQVVGIARAAEPAVDPAVAGNMATSPEPDRRRFLTRFLVPAGLTAGVAALGSGLLGLIARSPTTHGNRQPYALGWSAAARHRLTPVARVGNEPPMRPLPPLLDREVSFAGEVLPILLEKGGPHTHPPANSPPPHGVRLDSYEALVGAGEGEHGEPEGAHAEEEPAGGEPHGHQLVVPGKPEESLLVMMLLDRARQMPPSIPLSDGEIQLIASWIAQGARNN